MERVLGDGGIEHTASFTQRPGHATEIVRDAIAGGARFFAAMGGDGTVHEVVNGMMTESGPAASGLVLGLLPSGSGCDFARTFGLPQEPAAAAAHLLGDGLWGTLDVARVRYRTFDGEPGARWFVNIAEAGIGARVVVTAARMPRRFGGRAYRLAALKAIATFKPLAAHIAMNGRKAHGKTGTALGPLEHDATVTMVVVANGQFFGGGLRVAPRAIPSDAMLDVLVGEGSKWAAVSALRKMPRGAHVPDPAFTEYLADRVQIDGERALMIEADGEPLGTTPASFDLVPDAIALKI